MNMILDVLWFFLPAGIANMIPVVVAKAPFTKDWIMPVNEKLFGRNKTYRGIIFGTLVASLLAAVQYKVTPEFYENLNSSFDWPLAAVLGALLGFGALFGDMVESYFKRRRGVKPGESWAPFDQIDYVIGAIIFTLPIVRLSLVEYALIILLYFGLHIVIVYIFYKLGVREKPI